MTTSAAHRLTVADGSFLRGGRPHQIISGAIHYFRVHPDLWEDRLRRLAAMGLNTVETYVAWNFHERRRGDVDFTGPRDLARFVRLAGDLGLDVIVRPGPYICAEWDFGGLPAWLMKGEPMALRSSDPRFLAAVDAWLDAVCPVLVGLLATHGGPVVAIQVENEYGSFGDDATYLEHCRKGLVDRGIDVLLLTSDGPGPDWLAAGTIPGVLATVNFGSRASEAFAELRKVQPEGPDMCMEYWNGWFDHWGEGHHVRDAEDAARVLDDMLRAGASVNFYMAHGGTNFGLWNGANVAHGKLQPTVTSYDYDAAVGEAGELRPKFHAFRDVIRRYAAEPAPAVPELPARLAPQAVEVDGWVALLDSLGAYDRPRRGPLPLPMESLDQDHGLILYRGSALVPPDGRTLELDGLADRATVLVDGAHLGTLDRNEPPHVLPLRPRADGRASTIDVIVENQGRINFGSEIGERKGVAGIRIAHRFVHDWGSVAIRLDEPGLTDRLQFGAVAGSAGPVFARATLAVDEPADGFLALPGWAKGFVWLNGALLGRYWEVGPQVTLYAPAPFWRAGANEVVVLEMERAGSLVELRADPDLGHPRP
ncbi:beta-galactosidase family protein [Intrasporangium sp. DVR]|uniref:glycoside hydrolase family 35 protein n=1 Tax=Intrasporangium sp. DVR TaxID=3127867 RepID=UPI00313A5CFE